MESEISYLTSSELSVLPAHYHRVSSMNGVIIINIARMNGRNTFHVSDINRSYRIRGSVPRTQINKIASPVVLIDWFRSVIRMVSNEGKKRAAENADIARILVYSAIKISANGPLLYSVLNPDTSSDSPSAWSNGVRLVSANIVVNQMKNSGSARIEGHIELDEIIEEKLYDMNISRGAIKINAIETS